MSKNINNKRFLDELVDVTKDSPRNKSSSVTTQKPTSLFMNAHNLNSNFYMLH